MTHPLCIVADLPKMVDIMDISCTQIEESANAPAHDQALRHVIGSETRRGSARVDRLTGANVYSDVVGTAFKEKTVRAIMRTETNGQKTIKYYCHAHGIDMGPEDFTWSQQALDFKDASGVEHSRSSQLSETTAKPT